MPGSMPPFPAEWTACRRPGRSPPISPSVPRSSPIRHHSCSRFRRTSAPSIPSNRPGRTCSAPVRSTGTSSGPSARSASGSVCWTSRSTRSRRSPFRCAVTGPGWSASRSRFVSERVHEGTAAQDLVWTGHAADSCAAVLGRFAFDLQDARTALEDIATEYHEVAEAARKKGEALGHLVAVVADIVGSFGGAMIVEGPEFLAAIRNLDDLIELICHGIETLVATLEGKSAALELKADLLSLMLTGSMDASLSDAMPVLPTPPHGR